MEAFKLKRNGIAVTAAKVYRQIEQTAVGSYSRMERTVVNAYLKMEQIIVTSFNRFIIGITKNTFRKIMNKSQNEN